jgi:hypothetical protein
MNLVPSRAVEQVINAVTKEKFSDMPIEIREGIEFVASMFYDLGLRKVKILTEQEEKERNLPCP